MTGGRAPAADLAGGETTWRERAVAALGIAWSARPALLLTYLTTELVTGATPVGVAWLTRHVLDELLAGRGPVGSLVAHAVLLACLGLVMAALPYLSQYVQAELGRVIRLHAQDRLYEALSRFGGLARFEDPAFHDRIGLAQQASGMAPQTVLDAVLGGVRATVTMTGFAVTLLTVHPAMAGLVLVSAVPALVAELALSRRRGRLLWTTSPNVRRQLFYSQLMTDRTAAKEIRLFGLGGFVRSRMLSELRQVNAAERGLDRRILRTQAGLAALAAVVSGGGLVWTVLLARAGELTPGDVVVFIAAVAGTQTGLSGLVTLLASGHQGLLQFGHYLAVLNAGPDLATPDSPLPARPLQGAIELKDVWFRYDADKPWVLRGVDLRIPRGALLAVVGVNGAGKSTLVKLLCRLYEPTRGSITWDGVDIRLIPVAELRERIGTVFQDHMNYDFTAAENIGIGDLAALEDRDRIRVAATAAEAHEAVSGLPYGYDTLLSRIFFMNSRSDGRTAGVTLSGGQWQRIALARGLMRGRRDLLVLDEPSSGLDAEAEHTIHRRLVEHRRGVTSVIISHRLNAVRMADHIVVLSGGRVTEQGAHEELMAVNGDYARLFRLQALGYDTGQEPQAVSS
ncbi:ABC transporter ATP-binding protein [Streptosporangium carneum]|uniref:Multidrug ABC transporter permease n=1 Tax=Streptosporangium carneum TaxID=47481 RepID=A0A9W6MDU9_9ACTN|nr:ABC transporter ATP-binding protein [Streptosporangium carneum]GLK10884.1 multidrug ABC transporter permease [Streptosporangium carneum]